jgi:hypothetical protein
MAGRRCAQNAILPDEQLLDTVSCTDLYNQLDNFGVIISAITTDDEKRAFDAFRDGEEDRCDEGLAVVGLLEDRDLLS